MAMRSTLISLAILLCLQEAECCGVKPSITIPRECWHDQKLDHFMASEQRVFKQRFFIDLSSYKPGGPCFLLLGGESSFNGESYDWFYNQRDSASSLMNSMSFWVKAGQEFGAALIGLEHRYYGRTTPNASPAFLSSRQAVEDSAHFIRAANKNIFGGRSPRWVAFGYSYSGSLGVWLKQKHPALIEVAVASSAPLRAQLGFGKEGDWQNSATCFDFFDDALETIENVNEECFQKTKTLLRGFKKRLPELQDEIGVCDRITNWNSDQPMAFYMFMANFAALEFQIIGGSDTINKICHATPKITPLTEGFILRGLAKQVNTMTRKANLSCFPSSNEQLTDITKFPLLTSVYKWVLPWWWQNCVEFGFFFTTGSGLTKELIGDLLPISSYERMCMSLFLSVDQTLTEDRIRNAPSATNVYYGTNQFLNGTKIILTQGGNDPWRHRAPLNVSPGVLVINIEGQRHMSDFYLIKGVDYSPTQIKTLEQLKVWLH